MRMVALLSDFGHRDAYVGSMKGTMLGIKPDLQFMDLCHEIERGNILSASYVLFSAFDVFPVGTVFVAVVDPGVGQEDCASICYVDGKVIIGPNNGLFSMLGRMKERTNIDSIDIEKLTELRDGHRISETFHGRDVYAPAAAYFCSGKEDEFLGNPMEPLILPEALSSREEEGTLIRAYVLHIDQFGNVITGINRWESGKITADSCHIELDDFSIQGVLKSYGDVALGEELAYWGSSDFLELGINGDSFAQRHSVKVGDAVVLKA